MTIDGTSQAPSGLPGTGTVSLNVRMGTWTSVGLTFHIRVVMSPGGYSERTASSGTCTTTSITQTAGISSSINLIDAPQLIRKTNNGRVYFHFSVQYSTSLANVEMFVIVRNSDYPDRGFLTSAVEQGSGLSLSSLPGTSSNLTIAATLGSWVSHFAAIFPLSDE